MGVNCKLCGKTLFKQSNLNKHLRNVHKLEELEASALCYNKNKWNYKCLELNCDRSYYQNKGLIDHLEEAHNKKIDIKEFKLSSKNEFEDWKSAIELKYQCRYVVYSKRSNTSGQITYYNCSRSRTGKTGCKERQRQLKSRGSCKLNFCCTSQIKLINEGKSSNEVTVHWNKTHYGHSLELLHLRLQKSERENVALHLINGVTARKIVDQTRDKIGEQLKRIDLLTVKDVNNIKNTLKIEAQEGKRYDDTDSCVRKCNSKTSGESPVLVCEQQGIISNISEGKDFCLTVMNNKESKTVCMEKKLDQNIVNNIRPAMVDETSSKDLNDNLEDKIKNILQTLQNCEWKSLDDTVILQIHAHLNVLNTLLSLATAETNEDVQGIENDFFAKKNISSQLHLFSTEEKSNAITNICKKPSNEETEQINDILNNKPVLFISRNAKNDHMYL